MKLSPLFQRHSDSLPRHSDPPAGGEESSALARNNLTMKQFNNALNKEFYPAPASFRSGAGFTLIELLIVITLIGILAVAVLSAINPIEQVNKARDARSRGDSAQLLGAIDRYFAANLEFPWTEYTGTSPSQLDNDDTFGGSAFLYGVGVCGASGGVVTGDANTAGGGSGGCAYDGLLIDTEELKGAFTSKSYFESTVSDANALWVFKEAADPSIWICFKPSAKVNQDKALDANSVLKALTFGTAATGEDTVTAITQCDGDPTGGTTPATFSWTGAKDDWCFMCVPE